MRMFGGELPGLRSSISFGTALETASNRRFGDPSRNQSRLTEGFTDEFFDTYHLIHPRSEPYYDERVKLYELYHHLNVSPSTVHVPSCPPTRAHRRYSPRGWIGSLLTHKHTLIFGGGYKAGALKIMRSLITWAQSVRKP